MMVRNTRLRAAALASTCLLPLAAFAQSADLNNEVSVGAQYTSGNSAMFGRYNGDWSKGAEALLGFHVQKRDDWDSGKTYGYDITGKNLNIGSHELAPEAALGIKVGNQGQWGAAFNYDAITYFQSDSFHTIYKQDGTGALIPGITAGATQSWKAYTLPESIDDVKTRRDRFTATGKYNLGNGFEVSGTLFHEHKQGTMEQSLSVGGTTSNVYPVSALNPVINGVAYPATTFYGGGTTGIGGSTAASATTAVLASTKPGTSTSAYGALVYFPQPIDYDTDRYDAKIKYKGGNLQGELLYSYSNFANSNIAFNDVNPFSPLGPASLATQSNLATSSSWSLPASNSQHAVTADVAYNLPANTTVAGTFQYALQMANNQLPGFQNNPNSAITAAQAIDIAKPIGFGASDRWNAMAKVMNGNVTITSRPLAHLDLKAAYTLNTYQNEEARTPLYTSGSAVDNSAYPAGTTAPATCLGASEDACTIPWAWTKQKASLDAGYTVMPGTRVGLGYAMQVIDRQYMMDDHSQEGTLSARLNTRMADNLFGNLSYEHGNRTVGHLNTGTPNVVLEQNAYYAANNQAGAWFEAQRTSDLVKGNVMLAVNRQVSLGVNGQYVNENYPRLTVEGMDWDKRASAGPQVTYRPSDSVSANLYYNYQEAQYHMHSPFGTICQSNGTNGTVAGVQNSAANPTAAGVIACAAGYTAVQSGTSWGQTNSDGTHTVGVNLEWVPIKDVLKIGFDYNLSRGDISWAYADNIAATTLAGMTPYNAFAWTYQPIPNVTNTLNSLKLHGEYSFTPSMSLWMGYTWERLLNSDYQTAVNQAAYYSDLLTGDANPSYNIHVVAAALKVKF
ncbi:MAG TPA: MtrB/PioB family decaheme-associated outer membrane protein [Rhodospirillaceae bacterium]|nr:MtrB/PioB family decaheme-associated outer membrane protein [Rhodospirillaceae bacterium]